MHADGDVVSTACVVFFLRRFFGVQQYHSNTYVSCWSCSCHNSYQGEIANGVALIFQDISYQHAHTNGLFHTWRVSQWLWVIIEIYIYILKYMYRLECNYLNISQWLKALYVAFGVRWHKKNTVNTLAVKQRTMAVITAIEKGPNQVYAIGQYKVISIRRDMWKGT